MAETMPLAPEPAVPEIPVAGATTPKAAGMKRILVAGALILATIVGVCLLLFGAKAVKRMHRKQVTPPAEAAIRPPTTGDPLQMNTDYRSLMEKPVVRAPETVPPQQPTAAPIVPQAEPARPSHKPAQKDPGMLVLEGKYLAKQRQPAVAQYAPAPAPEDGREASTKETAAPADARMAWKQRAGALKATEVTDRLHTPESPYMLMAGTWIPAVLEGGINSQLPGNLKARVRQHVYSTVEGNALLIPQGTVILGEYDARVIWGEDRIMVVWTRLVFENGQSIQLEGMDGVDMAGTTGLRDKVNNHYWQLLGAVLMSSVLTVGVQIPAGTPSRGEYYQDLPQQFAQQFAQGINQAGQQIIRRELQRPPVITIRPGMSLNVFVHRDLVLERYTGAVAYRK